MSFLNLIMLAGILIIVWNIKETIEECLKLVKEECDCLDEKKEE